MLVDPMRWQLWPLALAVVVLGLASLRGGVPAWPWWVGCGALAGLSLALLAGFPAGRLPAPGGPFPVGVASTELTRQDPAGPRRLLVKVWYPAASAKGPREPLWSELQSLADVPAPMRGLLAYLRKVPTRSVVRAQAAQTGGPFPLIVYNHSFVSFASENSLLLQDLASRGYVVLSIRHQGQMAEARAGGELDFKAASAIVGRRTADSRFVLGSLPAVLAAVPQGASITSPERFGAIGLSLGGAISTRLCQEDRRCAGAVNLDGGLQGVTDPGRLDRPYLMVFSEANAGGNGAVRSAPLYEQMVPPGTRHIDFHDLTVIAPGLRWVGVLGPGGGPALSRRVREATAGFFARALPRRG